MSNQILLSPYKLGKTWLSNRLIMAPLTRQRAGKGFVPTDLMAKYYAQRATAGLIISEGTQISQQAMGYYDTPGIYTKEQLRGWQKVTSAVHDAGGRIFAQLWHVGRRSHPYYQPNGDIPLAPSAVKEQGHIRTKEGKLDTVVPRAMTIDDIQRTIKDYKNAAKNAKEAGFDGVEIHGANGYLIDQFLQNGTNKRDDEYGGSVENRSRFLIEITEAILEIWTPGQIGIRLSPSGLKGDMYDTDPKEIFTYVIQELSKYQLAYLHLIEPLIAVEEHPQYPSKVASFYRKFYKGTLVACGNHTIESAEKELINGNADLIAFGRLFISNPDLVDRIRKQADLNEWDSKLFYGGDEKGYTDYPFMNDKKKVQKKDDSNGLTRRYCCKL